MALLELIKSKQKAKKCTFSGALYNSVQVTESPGTQTPEQKRLGTWSTFCWKGKIRVHISLIMQRLTDQIQDQNQENF